MPQIGTASGRRRQEAWDVRLLEPAGCSKLWGSSLLPAGEQALCLKIVYLRNGCGGRRGPGGLYLGLGGL
ncbi:hypothetical protein GPECTOR_30g199 [Gonium pectorale]|uniref:Uncharacterized protein n=1 Tax=Gonium pectorale TaxID=33097 RepID=A0A150GE43_GONPE|nr:hypothetical protein GPECTOR_30g199 [Gonium pectorale]|eukprot:KXZ48104.1 hypothetical protein GPECTOR_30g199 [Gonium pectorale]